MFLTRLKIGQRLGLGFGSVLVLLVAIAALAWYSLQASRAATDRVIMMEKRSALTDEWAASTQLNINRVMALAKSSNHPALDAHYKPLIAKTTERINEIQKILDAEISSEHGRALLKDIAQRRTEYIDARKGYFELLKGGDMAAAESALNGKLMPAADRYTASQAELQAYERELLDKAVAASNATLDRQVVILFALAAAAVALGALVAWRIARSITQPLDEAVAVANAVAAGDLTRSVDSQRRDELGELLRALGAMKA